MVTWIIYDISSNALRSKVAKACQAFGLYRVQESVFLGELSPQRRDEIFLLFQSLLDPATDRLFLSPLCHKDFQAIQTFGRSFDPSLIDATRQTFHF